MNIFQQLTRVIRSIALLPLLVFLAADKKKRVGGQAIIEGVMMRGKQKVSWAVRKPDGEAVVETVPFVSICKKYRILRIPAIRGAINLFESLQLGFKALSRSAELAEEKKEDKKPTVMDSVISFATLAFSLVFSFGFFLYLPLKILSFFITQDSAFLYNILAGVLRISFFLAYLIVISMWKDIRRIFEYHGAEHKVIFAYEADKELTVDAAREYTTFHPRCGTSFILLVTIVCIFLFSIIDAIIIHFFGPYPNVITRSLVHIVLIPFVSGLSYEVLRFSDKHQNIPIMRLMIQPGLWLQHITTKEPSDEQLSIALKALRAVL
jgi:uncharacterized protein YqhQ